MKIILDTANIRDIKKWAGITGSNVITTNPHILKENGIDTLEKFTSFILELEEIMLSPSVFFQCMDTTDVDTLVQYKAKLESKTNVNYVAKVTMLPEYYDIIKKAKEAKLETAATTCYDLAQIHQAAEMDMDYTMVYFAKNENETLLNDAVKMKKNYGYDIELVAASFRTKKDFVTALKTGIDAATVRPETLEEVYKNNDTVADVVKIIELK